MNGFFQKCMPLFITAVPEGEATFFL